MSPLVARRVNAAADTAAGAYGSKCRSDMGLDSWLKGHDEAAEWGRSALQLAQQVADHSDAFLDAHPHSDIRFRRNVGPHPQDECGRASSADL